VRCIACKADGSRVRATRTTPTEIRRQRFCPCGAVWWTSEKPERATLNLFPPKPVSNDHSCAVMTIPGQALSGSDPVSLSVSGSGPSLSSPEIEKNYNTMEPAGPRRKPTVHFAVLSTFSETWKAKYGVDYIPTPGDHGQLKRFLAVTPEAALAELPRAFERYLEDEGAFVMREMRHSLTYFLTSNAFNKYRTPEVLVISKRDAENHRAGEQWLAMETARRNGHGGR
jgi:hypothetical protein